MRPAAGVHVQLLDRRGRLAAVRLQAEVPLSGPLDLVRAAGVWSLELARPDVDRMEYLFEIVDHNGHRATITDPANPRRVGGAFGDKSVLEFPEYSPPAWLDLEPVAGTEHQLDVTAGDVPLSVTVWSPADLPDDEPAPQLLVHDGPEYATLGGLTHYLGALIGAGRLPAMRAVLLDPGDRNAEYCANPEYARAVNDLLTGPGAALPSATRRIGLGASLGGLAMLHLQRTNPGLLDAQMLQSGSFFTAELDEQESQFSGFAAVTRFVAGVHADVGADADTHAGPVPIPTVLTCGTVEENLANNRAMTATLQRLGYPAELVVVRDAHNYTAWRDALDPHLTGLITEVTGAA